MVVIRKPNLVLATSHGFFGQNTELLTLSTEPFENSLVNSTALRLAIQNLWQEVTIIKTSSFPDESEPTQKLSNGCRSLRFSDWSVVIAAAIWLVLPKRLTSKAPHGRKVSSFGGIFIVLCIRNFSFPFSYLLTLKLCTFSPLYRIFQALNMGAECGFQTKQQLNECILRCPWSEYPLPPVHRACRDGDLLSLIYLTVQGDRLAVFRSINAQDQFLMWTPAHWAAYFGKV